MAGNDDHIETRVLDAAQGLFLHYGFDKTTVNDIAREAGVAKSTIYTRWNKKEAIFDTLIWRESKRYTEDWMARVEADPQGGTYGAWMRHALGAFFENEFLRVLYKQDRRMIGGLLQRQGMENLFVRRKQMFETFFKQMQQANVVRQDIDAGTLSYLMNSLQYGLIHMIDIIPEDATPEMDDVLTMMVDMLERYVTLPEGADREAGKQVLRQFMMQVRQLLDAFEHTHNQP
ncbi:MAG: TetR/AcrR family transcriptional regulator [Anaerolineae bacterium]